MPSVWSTLNPHQLTALSKQQKKALWQVQKQQAKAAAAAIIPKSKPKRDDCNASGCAQPIEPKSGVWIEHKSLRVGFCSWLHAWEWLSKMAKTRELKKCG